MKQPVQNAAFAREGQLRRRVRGEFPSVPTVLEMKQDSGGTHFLGEDGTPLPELVVTR